MARQYLDVMTWNGSETAPTRDSDGNPIPATPVPVTNSQTRYENFNAGNRKEFLGLDGESVFATGVVYAKLGTEVPEKFSWIEVTRDSEVVFSGKVLNVYKGQLNNTLHVLENVRN